MKRSEVFKSRFLCAADLDSDSDTVVEITKEHMDALQDPKSGEMLDKLLLGFAQLDKQLVVNQTNWDTIEILHGGESADWVGKWIALYVDPTVRVGAKRVGGIRVREDIPGDPSAVPSAGPSIAPPAQPAALPTTPPDVPAGDEDIPF